MTENLLSIKGHVQRSSATTTCFEMRYLWEMVDSHSLDSFQTNSLGYNDMSQSIGNT